MAQDFFPSRYVPFLYPVPAWHVWYLLAVPLCAAVAIVYKSIRCRSMNKVPKEAAKATAWLLIVPVVSIWWMWKDAGGVEHVTRGKSSQVIAFILMFVLGVIGMAIIQDAFNKVADQGQLPNARAMG